MANDVPAKGSGGESKFHPGMQSRLVQIIALVAVVRMTAGISALSQELPPANPDPKDIRALDQLKFNTLLVNRNTQEYSVNVEVNGTPYATYGSGSGWQVDHVPFQEGTNHLTVSFTPGPTKNPARQSGTLTLVLADDAHPKPNHSLILYQFSAADHAFCVTGLTFQFVSGQPSKLHVKEDHWVDAGHKKLIYEMFSYGSNWGPYDQVERSWWPDGRPIDESTYKLSEQTGSLALSESKDYKLDGTLAGEVKNGEGVRRTYSQAGVLTTETFYHGGMANGLYKEFDEHGVLRITGNFTADQQDGTWIRYDARGRKIAQCVYANGQPDNGAAPIDPGSTTAPSNP